MGLLLSQRNQMQKLTLKVLTASWCNQCPSVKAAVQHLPDNIQVELLDADSNMILTKQLNIRSLPTIVLFDESGGELFRSTGITSVEKLKNYLGIE
jgi:thioredoxin-like negative regulator of GroEL